MGASRRVGVVGAGWGAVTHVPAFRAARGYIPVALCGRDTGRLARAAASCGLDDTSRDWESFIERRDLDVIAVATSPASHVEIASRAVAAGKHVIIEKPIAPSVESGRALADQAEAAGVIAAACFELRWLPERYALWDLVRSGRLGDLYHLRAHTNSPNWHPTHHPQAEWMYRRDEGGGYLRGTMSHDIDFVRAIAGELTTLCADVATTIPSVETGEGRVIEVDADDTAMLLARSERGAAVSISTCNVAAQRSSGLLEVFGCAGSAVLSRDETTTVLRFAEAGRPDGFAAVEFETRLPEDDTAIPQRGAAMFARSMALMLEDLLPAFDGGSSIAPTISDGVAVDEIIDRAERSARLGRWLRLDRRQLEPQG